MSSSFDVQNAHPFSYTKSPLDQLTSQLGLPAELTLLLQQLAQSQLSKTGMNLYGLTSSNAATLAENYSNTQMQYALMQQTGSLNKQNIINLMKGVSLNAGMGWGEKQAKAADAWSSTISSILPYVNAVLPGVADILGGRAGNPNDFMTLVAPSIIKSSNSITGNYGMRISEGARSAKEMWQSLYTSEDSGRRMLKSDEMGAMYDWMFKTGRIQAAEGSPDRFERMAAKDYKTTLSRIDENDFSGKDRELIKQKKSLAKDFNSFGESLDDLVDGLSSLGSRKMLSSLDITAKSKAVKDMEKTLGAVKEFFGDSGQPDAPMSSLISAMESLTGGSSTISQNQMAKRLRDLATNAKMAGMDVNGLVEYSQSISSSLAQYGAPKTLQASVVSSNLAFRAAEQQVGLMTGLGAGTAQENDEIRTRMHAEARNSPQIAALAAMDTLKEMGYSWSDSSDIGKMYNAIKNQSATTELTIGGVKMNRPTSLLTANDFLREAGGIRNAQGVALNPTDLYRMMFNTYNTDKYINEHQDVAQLMSPLQGGLAALNIANGTSIGFNKNILSQLGLVNNRNQPLSDKFTAETFVRSAIKQAKDYNGFESAEDQRRFLESWLKESGLDASLASNVSDAQLGITFGQMNNAAYHLYNGRSIAGLSNLFGNDIERQARAQSMYASYQSDVKAAGAGFQTTDILRHVVDSFQYAGKNNRKIDSLWNLLGGYGGLDERTQQIIAALPENTEGLGEELSQQYAEEYKTIQQKIESGEDLTSEEQATFDQLESIKQGDKFIAKTENLPEAQLTLLDKRMGGLIRYSEAGKVSDLFNKQKITQLADSSRFATMGQIAGTLNNDFFLSQNGEVTDNFKQILTDLNLVDITGNVDTRLLNTEQVQNQIFDRTRAIARGQAVDYKNAQVQIMDVMQNHGQEIQDKTESIKKEDLLHYAQLSKDDLISESNKKYVNVLTNGFDMSDLTLDEQKSFIRKQIKRLSSGSDNIGQQTANNFASEIDSAKTAEELEAVAAKAFRYASSSDPSRLEGDEAYLDTAEDIGVRMTTLSERLGGSQKQMADAYNLGFKQAEAISDSNTGLTGKEFRDLFTDTSMNEDVRIKRLNAGTKFFSMTFGQSADDLQKIIKAVGGKKNYDEMINKLYSNEDGESRAGLDTLLEGASKLDGGIKQMTTEGEKQWFSMLSSTGLDDKSNTFIDNFNKLNNDQKKEKAIALYTEDRDTYNEVFGSDVVAQKSTGEELDKLVKSASLRKGLQKFGLNAHDSREQALEWNQAKMTAGSQDDRVAALNAFSMRDSRTKEEIEKQKDDASKRTVWDYMFYADNDQTVAAEMLAADRAGSKDAVVSRIKKGGNFSKIYAKKQEIDALEKEIKDGVETPRLKEINKRINILKEEIAEDTKHNGIGNYKTILEKTDPASLRAYMNDVIDTNGKFFLQTLSGSGDLKSAKSVAARIALNHSTEYTTDVLASMLQNGETTQLQQMLGDDYKKIIESKDINQINDALAKNNVGGVGAYIGQAESTWDDIRQQQKGKAGVLSGSQIVNESNMSDSAIISNLSIRPDLVKDATLRRMAGANRDNTGNIIDWNMNRNIAYQLTKPGESSIAVLDRVAFGVDNGYKFTAVRTAGTPEEKQKAREQISQDEFTRAGGSAEDYTAWQTGQLDDATVFKTITDHAKEQGRISKEEQTAMTDFTNTQNAREMAAPTADSLSDAYNKISSKKIDTLEKQIKRDQNDKREEIINHWRKDAKHPKRDRDILDFWVKEGQQNGRSEEESEKAFVDYQKSKGLSDEEINENIKIQKEYRQNEFDKIEQGHVAAFISQKKEGKEATTTEDIFSYTTDKIKAIYAREHPDAEPLSDEAAFDEASKMLGQRGITKEGEVQNRYKLVDGKIVRNKAIGSNEVDEYYSSKSGQDELEQTDDLMVAVSGMSKEQVQSSRDRRITGIRKGITDDQRSSGEQLGDTVPKTTEELRKANDQVTTATATKYTEAQGGVSGNKSARDVATQGNETNKLTIKMQKIQRELSSEEKADAFTKANKKDIISTVEQAYKTGLISKDYKEKLIGENGQGGVLADNRGFLKEDTDSLTKLAEQSDKETGANVNYNGLTDEQKKTADDMIDIDDTISGDNSGGTDVNNVLSTEGSRPKTETILEQAASKDLGIEADQKRKTARRSLLKDIAKSAEKDDKIIERFVDESPDIASLFTTTDEKGKKTVDKKKRAQVIKQIKSAQSEEGITALENDKENQGDVLLNHAEEAIGKIAEQGSMVGTVLTEASPTVQNIKTAKRLEDIAGAEAETEHKKQAYRDQLGEGETREEKIANKKTLDEFNKAAQAPTLESMFDQGVEKQKNKTDDPKIQEMIDYHAELMKGEDFKGLKTDLLDYTVNKNGWFKQSNDMHEHVNDFRKKHNMASIENTYLQYQRSGEDQAVTGTFADLDKDIQALKNDNDTIKIGGAEFTKKELTDGDGILALKGQADVYNLLSPEEKKRFEKQAQSSGYGKLVPQMAKALQVSEEAVKVDTLTKAKTENATEVKLAAGEMATTLIRQDDKLSKKTRDNVEYERNRSDVTGKVISAITGSDAGRIAIDKLMAKDKISEEEATARIAAEYTKKSATASKAVKKGKAINEDALATEINKGEVFNNLADEASLARKNEKAAGTTGLGGAQNVSLHIDHAEFNGVGEGGVQMQDSQATIKEAGN